MSVSKPILFGGGVALVLWLLTRDMVDKSKDSPITEELHQEFGGSMTAKTFGTGELVKPEIDFTVADGGGNEVSVTKPFDVAMYDSETGKCLAGCTISAQVHDKLILDSQGTGGIGSENHG